MKVATRDVYSKITSRPLLALASEINIQAAQHPYMSAIVDNWQSLGIDIHDLGADPKYHKLLEVFRQTLPDSSWKVVQHVANARVRVFLRMDQAEWLTKINGCVKTLWQDAQPQLRVRQTVADTTPSGRRDHTTNAVIQLTTATKIGPPPAESRPLAMQSDSSRPSTAVARPVHTPITGPTYAAIVQSQIEKRKQVTGQPALNHTARKKNRSSTSAQQPPPRTSATTAPVARHAPAPKPASQPQADTLSAVIDRFDKKLERMQTDTLAALMDHFDKRCELMQQQFQQQLL